MKTTCIGTVSLNAPRDTVEMEENMSYGPVRVQSQTAIQEPVYEVVPDTIKDSEENVCVGENVAYGHIRP